MHTPLSNFLPLVHLFCDCCTWSLIFTAWSLAYRPYHTLVLDHQLYSLYILHHSILTTSQDDFPFYPTRSIFLCSSWILFPLIPLHPSTQTLHLFTPLRPSRLGFWLRRISLPRLSLASRYFPLRLSIHTPRSFYPRCFPTRTSSILPRLYTLLHPSSHRQLPHSPTYTHAFPYPGVEMGNRDNCEKHILCAVRSWRKRGGVSRKHGKAKGKRCRDDVELQCGSGVGGGV